MIYRSRIPVTPVLAGLLAACSGAGTPAVGVAQEDVWVVAGVTLMVVAIIFFLYRQLLFTTFDHELAKVYGVRTERVDTVFALVLAAP